MSRQKVLQLMAILCFVVSIAALGIFAWASASENFEKQERLNKNIGEVARIDEVLTSSALLAVTTGEAKYRNRYFIHVNELDQLLRATLDLFENSTARRHISDTEEANAVLVQLETLALDGTENGPSSEAYAILTSDEYRLNKDRYSRGVDMALTELKNTASHKAGLMRLSLWGFAISLFAMMCFSLRSLWASRVERIERRNHDAKLETIRAMLNTFMDLQNNLLNNMIYFRTKAAHNLAFDEEEVSLIDREIKSAKEKLAAITETEFAETRDLGGIVVVTSPDEPGHFHDPANANAA